MNKKILAIVGILVLVIIVAMVLRSSTIAKNTNKNTSDSAAKSRLTTDIESASLTPTDLESISGGVATRQFIDGIFVHGITAVLPDLPAGQFYAGWLIPNDGATAVVATGTLTKQSDSYMLNYSSPIDYRTYSSIAVTIQTAQNQPMQTAVISGMFGTN